MRNVNKGKCAKFERIKGKEKSRVEQSTREISEENIKKWVMNCSDRTLSEPEKRVLAKDLNYSVAPKKFPVVDYITATANACKNLSSEKASQLQATMCSMLRKPANLKVEQNLDRSEREALRDLKNDKSVTILPADKG